MEYCQDAIDEDGCGDAPKSFQEAMRLPKEKSDKWKTALVKEYESHVKNGSLGPPCVLPKGYKAVPLDVVLKIKRDGTYKLRAIVKGFYMKAGLDCNETFSPVPNIATFRILLALQQSSTGRFGKVMFVLHFSALIWMRRCMPLFLTGLVATQMQRVLPSVKS